MLQLINNSSLVINVKGRPYTVVLAAEDLTFSFYQASFNNYYNTKTPNFSASVPN